MTDPASKLRMKLTESQFPFSRRMRNFFRWLEINTIEELAAIPLIKLSCFRGFKTQCRKELIAFIKFEQIESLFEGFHTWEHIV